MEELVEIIVDGKKLAASQGISLLQVLKSNGIDIPALCFHPALDAYGSCGLCMVEIWNNDIWEVRHSCLSEVEAGMQIVTNTPRLKLLRAWAARIILRRGPFANMEIEELLVTLQEEITEQQEDQDLAENIKVLSGALTEGCILCGLCVRVCSKVGKNHLTFLGKGKNLRIGFVPGKDENSSCGNCHACQNICPTGFIYPNAEHAFKARLYKD